MVYMLCGIFISGFAYPLFWLLASPPQRVAWKRNLHRRDTTLSKFRCRRCGLERTISRNLLSPHILQCCSTGRAIINIIKNSFNTYSFPPPIQQWAKLELFHMAWNVGWFLPFSGCKRILMFVLWRQTQSINQVLWVFWLRESCMLPPSHARKTY